MYLYHKKDFYIYWNQSDFSIQAANQISCNVTAAHSLYFK